ncbi:hypothetical protein MAPG_02029 [Magnaporthiopsis poae ATCC 64411]|uniref:Uncharacterized protein n=1 Tax=Magnaporthiopsis poae (strain ATCC 64411 / 73-15) TaxID=644358 RepID=A0A0C4DQ91_MAGP6|nr:hypothetical protein MAPG_02029 [Magnaporthiopsis poae ATCC 64411]
MDMADPSPPGPRPKIAVIQRALDRQHDDVGTGAFQQIWGIKAPNPKSWFVPVREKSRPSGAQTLQDQERRVVTANGMRAGQLRRLLSDGGEALGSWGRRRVKGAQPGCQQLGSSPSFRAKPSSTTFCSSWPTNNLVQQRPGHISVVFGPSRLPDFINSSRPHRRWERAVASMFGTAPLVWMRRLLNQTVQTKRDGARSPPVWGKCLETRGETPPTCKCAQSVSCSQNAMGPGPSTEDIAGLGAVSDGARKSRPLPLKGSHGRPDAAAASAGRRGGRPARNPGAAKQCTMATDPIRACSHWPAAGPNDHAPASGSDSAARDPEEEMG